MSTLFTLIRGFRRLRLVATPKVDSRVSDAFVQYEEAAKARDFDIAILNLKMGEATWIGPGVL